LERVIQYSRDSEARAVKLRRTGCPAFAGHDSESSYSIGGLMFRRTLMLLPLAVIASIAGAAAQTYPSQPIKMIVGFGPGSAADVLIRVVGKQMETSLGQPIVVENRPGNRGMTASDSVM